MAKGKKKSKQIKKQNTPDAKPRFQLDNRIQDIIYLSFITIVLVLLLKPMVLEGLSPQGVDVIAAKGISNQINEFREETGNLPLWNPVIFSGMPKYHDLAPVVFSVDSFLHLFVSSTGKAFIFYLFAAFGMYFLLRFLNMTPVIAFLGTVIFILMPHYKSLWMEGHFRKFRAIMYIPWIFLAFQYFLRKKSILAAALFAVAFGIQIRTQHYQIIFYTGLLIFAVGVYPFIKMFLEKKYYEFSRSSVLLLVSIVLAMLMAAQPLFLAREYLPYSKRGKTTIDISQPGQETDQQGGDGVSLEYATRWSTHPSELLTWIVPRFAGGMSAEPYEGDAVENMRGRDIPGYWGHMPFTQSYEYMGALTILLAVIGIYGFRKKNIILGMSLFAVFLTLLSFGRHFEWFYQLLFNYMPYFNKFRSPMMGVTVTFFIVAVLASYGMEWLRSQKRENGLFQRHKSIIYIIGGFIALGIVLYLAGFSFSFSKPGGERYPVQYLEMFQKIREELYYNDMVRYFILIILGGGGLLAYLSKKINFVVLGMVFVLITMVDFLTLSSHIQKRFIDLDKLERRYFRETQTDDFLQKDTDMFRVFPAGDMFDDNRWGYYHETIGGYSAVKMYTIEEVIQNNLYRGWDAKFPVNWNVLKILNVKYVIAQGQISHEKLEPVFSDEASKQFTYLFKNHLPRFYFVGSAEIIPDEYERLKRINEESFDPVRAVILEEAPEQPINIPDSSYTRVLEYSPNRILLEAFSDKQSMLVISIPHFPPGWKVRIGETPVEKIYKANHTVQAVVAPAGSHKIEIVFHPDSFFNMVNLAYGSVSVLYVAIVASLVMHFRNRKKP